MAKSFFERLTGGIQVNDDAGRAKTSPVIKETTKQKTKPDEAPVKAAVLHPSGEENSANDEASDGGSEEEGQLTVDIYDDGASIIIQSTVAGVKPEDIDISLEDNVLTVRGARRRQQEVGDENFYYRELYWGACV